MVSLCVVMDYAQVIRGRDVFEGTSAVVVIPNVPMRDLLVEVHSLLSVLASERTTTS